MKVTKFVTTIGLVGAIAGCASNITINMPQLASPSLESLAVVNVNDTRQSGVAASKREAAFGVPMGTIEFDPPETQIVKQKLETKLSELLKESGVRSKVLYDADLIEFGVNTDTTPLYWDVIGRIQLVLRNDQNQYDLFGTHTSRTYIWPGEDIIKEVIDESLNQITKQLKPVVFGSRSNAKAGNTQQGNSIRTPNYSIIVPPNTGWRQSSDGDRPEVLFFKKAAPPNTYIMRFSTNSLVGENPTTLTGKQVADEYRTGEKVNMIMSGVMTGQYELKDVVMGEAMVGEKLFYTMTYTTIADELEQRAYLYLHFPVEQGFSEFLVALYSESYPVNGDHRESFMSDFIESLKTLEMTE